MFSALFRHLSSLASCFSAFGKLVKVFKSHNSSFNTGKRIFNAGITLASPPFTVVWLACFLGHHPEEITMKKAMSIALAAFLMSGVFAVSSFAADEKKEAKETTTKKETKTSKDGTKTEKKTEKKEKKETK